MTSPAEKAHPKKRKNKGRPRSRLPVRVVSVLIIVALLATIAAMVASQFFPDVAALSLPRSIVVRLVTPIQKTFASATDGVVGYLRKLKLRSNLEHEYGQLLEKVNELTDQAMLVEELRYQLQSYADLDDEIGRNANLDGIKANVIGRDTSNYTFTLTIDVGEDQGVRDNMAVAVPGALVGYTYDVKRDRALVKGIVDTNCSIAALIESSRDQGTVRGTLAVDGTYACRMYYLSYSTLPRPGDRVVTSGVGMEFPKGIPIGHVRESTRGLEENRQFIVVEPIADFDHIEYVIVYRYRPSFAESALSRVQARSTFVPLEPLKPVPTLIGQQSVQVPGGAAALTDTPAPAPSPGASLSPAVSGGPGVTPTAQNFGYVDPAVPEGMPAPEPTPEPSPTPEPLPTWSIDQVTLEDDG